MIDSLIALVIWGHPGIILATWAIVKDKDSTRNDVLMWFMLGFTFGLVCYIFWVGRFAGEYLDNSQWWNKKIKSK